MIVSVMAIIRKDEDAMEELKKELARPIDRLPDRAEGKRPGRKRDTEKGSHALPCADMTWRCRIIDDR